MNRRRNIGYVFVYFLAVFVNILFIKYLIIEPLKIINLFLFSVLMVSFLVFYVSKYFNILHKIDVMVFSIFIMAPIFNAAILASNHYISKPFDIVEMDMKDYKEYKSQVNTNRFRIPVEIGNEKTVYIRTEIKQEEYSAQSIKFYVNKGLWGFYVLDEVMVIW